MKVKFHKKPLGFVVVVTFPFVMRICRGIKRIGVRIRRAIYEAKGKRYYNDLVRYCDEQDKIAQRHK